MGLFDKLKNLFKADKVEEYVYSAKELSSNTVKESKTFVPFGSLLKDTSGTFPRREKSEATSKETESKEKTKDSLFTRIFSMFKTKPPNKETIEQIQQLMEKNPAAAKVFFGIFDVKELKSIESYLDKNSKLGGQWLEFRDAATEVLKSKEADKKMQNDLGRIARAYGVEPRDLELKQVVEGEKRKREKGEFGREELDEKAMEGSAKMFEKAEEAAKKEMVLRQYPQTADFFRVVEREDENKLFSPNKSLLPKVSEIEAKKIIDIGMGKTTTSGFLSKVMYALRGIRSRDEEIGVKKQESLQQLADKLTLQLVDFWGIPNVKPFSVKVQIFDIGKDKKTRESLPWAGAVDKNGVHFILVNQDYLNEEFRSGLINIKSVLAEEVCHFLEDDVKSMYGKFTEDIYVSEFFGIISRFCISEQNPEMFHEDYRKYLHQAASFSIEKKQYEDALKKLAEDKRKIQSDMIEGRPTNPEELKRIEDEEKEIKDDLNHLSYYPGAAYYYEVKAMNPCQRFELLMESPQQIRNSIIEGKKLIEKLNSIGPKVYERESRKFTDAVMTKFGLEQSPGTASFFQKVAEEHRKTEYGRGVQTIIEKQRDLEMQIEMQGFVNQLSLKLADWWGIPRSQIEGKIPRIKVLPREQVKHPNGAFYQQQTNEIQFSKEFLKEPYGFMGWKAILGEEVGHFIEGVAGEKNPQLREFFGGMCRFLVADIVPGSFKYEYSILIRDALNFKEYLKDLVSKEAELKNKIGIGNPLLYKSGVARFGQAEFDRLVKSYRSVDDELLHILQKPAAFYLFKVKNMSREERYRLITDNDYAQNLILKFTGKKGEIGEVEKLKEKIQEREKITGENPSKLYDEYIQEYTPEQLQPSVDEKGRVNATAEEFEEIKEQMQKYIDKGLEGSNEFFQRVATETEIKTSNIEQSALEAGAIAGTLKGLENVGGFFQRAASEIGKAAYGRVTEAVAAKLEQQEPAIETDEVMKEYPTEEYSEEEQYPEQSMEEPSEPEEYQEAEQNLEEQTQGESEQLEEVEEEQYGPESEQVPSPSQINISIPDKVSKKVAKKLESMGVKLPKKMIKK